MNDSDTAKSTRTVDRAADLLLRVCNSDKPPTLAALAREVNLSPATALRLLRTLENHLLVAKAADGRYQPGAGMMQVAASVLGSTPIYKLAQPHLEMLAAATNESCYLAIRGPNESALYIRQVESEQAIRHASWVGQTVPLKGTAVGAALLGTPNTGVIIQRSSIELHVAAVAICVSVDGVNVDAAISVVGPSFRLSDADLARYGQLLERHSAALRQELLGAVNVAELPDEGVGQYTP